MSEIEKMYENAGVEYEERYNNCTLNKEGECKLKCSCDICKYSEEKYIYPPFTAEKQLELIKLFAKREVYINFQENKYYIYTMNIGGSAFGENLENALARYINKVWQDLTEEEKHQVKGILE